MTKEKKPRAKKAKTEPKPKARAVVVVATKAKVSSVNHDDCHPNCHHIKIWYASPGGKKHVQCCLDPDDPIDLKPIRKRLGNEDDADSLQAARRTEICKDMEARIAAWMWRSRFDKMFNAIM